MESESFAQLQQRIAQFHQAEIQPLAGAPQRPAQAMIAQLLDAGCPPFRTFALTTRMDAAKESIDSLTSAGLAYKGRLEAELERLNKQDDMRLAFAKRADALNRQLEEKIDELTEVSPCCCRAPKRRFPRRPRSQVRPYSARHRFRSPRTFRSSRKVRRLLTTSGKGRLALTKKGGPPCAHRPSIQQ